MDLKTFQKQLTSQLNSFNNKVNAFFTFLLNKLKNFQNLTLGEQASYICFGGGLLLVVISLILFMV